MMKNPFFKSINSPVRAYTPQSGYKLKGKALDARMNKKDAIANKVGDALATVARKVGFINPKAEGTSPYEFGVDTAHKMMDLVGYKKGGKVTRRKKQVIKQKQNVTQKVVINMPKSRRRKTTGSKSSSKTQAPIAGYTGHLPVSKKPDTDEWQKLNKSSVTVEDVTEKLQPKMLEFAKQLRLEQAKENQDVKQLIFNAAEQFNKAMKKPGTFLPLPPTVGGRGGARSNAGRKRMTDEEKKQAAAAREAAKQSAPSVTRSQTAETRKIEQSLQEQGDQLIQEMEEIKQNRGGAFASPPVESVVDTRSKREKRLDEREAKRLAGLKLN